MLEATPLKNGSGKEICRLHEITNQHMHALKAVKQDKYESLITAILESKMDSSMIKEWERYNRDQKTPPYTEVLKFLDLQAQDTENIVIRDDVRKQLVTKTYTASMEDTCVACKKDNHSLYGCKSFIALSP